MMVATDLIYADMRPQNDQFNPLTRAGNDFNT